MIANDNSPLTKPREYANVALFRNECGLAPAAEEKAHHAPSYALGRVFYCRVNGDPMVWRGLMPCGISPFLVSSACANSPLSDHLLALGGLAFHKKRNTAMNTLTLADINTTINHEPRILDLRLAEVLGFKDIYEIRRLIARHKAALERFGEVFGTVTKTSNKGGRPTTENHLNKKQAVYIAAKSETENATELTIQVIEVFDKATSGAATAQESLQVQTLSPQQKHALQEIVKHRAAQFPKGLQAGVYPRLWGALKQVFAVASYHEILAKDFDMACMILRNTNLDVIVPELSSNPLQLESSTPPQPTAGQLTMLLTHLSIVAHGMRGAGTIRDDAFWQVMGAMLAEAYPVAHDFEKAYAVSAKADIARYRIPTEPVRTALTRARKQQLLAA